MSGEASFPTSTQKTPFFVVLIWIFAYVLIGDAKFLSLKSNESNCGESELNPYWKGPKNEGFEPNHSESEPLHP